MGRKKNLESAAGNSPGADIRSGRHSAIERLINKITSSLPLLDKKALGDALTEVKVHPATSLHYLFDRFGDVKSPAHAVVAHVIARSGGADVVDNLNALIFDAAQDARVKVLANEILGMLGSPVDPDVFAMSVPDAEEIRRHLPWRALEMLADGDAAGAAAHAHTLEPTERYLLIHEAVARHPEACIEFLTAVAQQNSADASAVVGAVGSAGLAAGVPLLRDLQGSPDRTLQKLIKRTLFDLRKAGIEVPEEKPRAAAPGPAEVADSDLPVYRTMMSDPTPRGLILVIVARSRANGRLRVFSVLVDLWKRGIEQAALRLDMSKSSFNRFLASQPGSRMHLREAPIEECRDMVARGVGVAKELAAPLPLDFSRGKPLLGDIESAVAAVENPFRCSSCDAPLDAETVRKIRDIAAYDNIPAETRCPDCRKAAGRA